MPKLKKQTLGKLKKNTEVKKTEKKSDLLIPVYDLKGSELKKITLPEEIFSAKGSNKLLTQYVYVYLANQRQGTVSTKTRGEVNGSTKKIYRQKGTGRARHGDIKAPIFVGGGVVGGPKPRDYSLKMNKKQKRKALFLALTLKNKENAILAIEKKSIEPKTKFIVNFLSKLGLSKMKTLFILPEIKKDNFILASRNIPNVNLVDAYSINPYIILRADKIIFVDNSLSVLQKHFLKNNKK